MFLTKVSPANMLAARQLIKQRSVGAAVAQRLFSTSETTTAAALGLEKLGINNDKATVYRNLSYEDVAKHEKDNGEGSFVNNGTFAVDTGKFTGRSPGDKWIVKQAPSADKIWWGSVNQ